jgi:hypothetical protein
VEGQKGEGEGIGWGEGEGVEAVACYEAQASLAATTYGANPLSASFPIVPACSAASRPQPRFARSLADSRAWTRPARACGVAGK